MFLLSHPKTGSFHRETSTISTFAFLKFDIAKLGGETKECKEMTSTRFSIKPLINNSLQKGMLYKREKRENSENKRYGKVSTSVMRKQLIMRNSTSASLYNKRYQEYFRYNSSYFKSYYKPTKSTILIL